MISVRAASVVPKSQVRLAGATLYYATSVRRHHLCFRSTFQLRGFITRPSFNQKRYFRTSPSHLAPPKDPYTVLGVPKDAPIADIKKAYYVLARKFHPDTNKDSGAKEKFVEIQTAYDTLNDPQKRSAYDRYGAASQDPGFDPHSFSNARGPFGAGGFGGFQDFGAPFGASGGRSNADVFESLFGSVFGSNPRGAGRGFSESRMDAQGQDLEAQLNVTFMEACKGTSKNISIQPIVECSPCNGTGLKAGETRVTCKTCRGAGTTTFIVDSGFHMTSTCPTCKGIGSIIPKGSECGSCAGLGKVKVSKSTEVQVPAGVEDGMAIRINGEGDAPISGKGRPGDLLVRIRVTPSKVFRRQGTNLYYDARVPFYSAILGGRVRVPTLDGEVDVKVPVGTQQGEECVLKGRGVKSVFGKDQGDLFVTFSLTTPRSLTERQRSILQQYADEVSNGSVSPKPSSTKNQPTNSTSANQGSVDNNESRSNHSEESSGGKGQSPKDTKPHPSGRYPTGNGEKQRRAAAS